MQSWCSAGRSYALLMEDLRSGVDTPIYRKFEAGHSAVSDTADTLVESFNNGNRAAFTTIYNKLYQPVFYFACRFVGRETAEDITADVFCKLWGMQKKFVQLRQIKIFLQVAVRNACFSHLEHAEVVQRHKKNILYASDEKTEDLFYEDQVKAEYLKRIFAAIGKLPTKQKKIFTLSFLDGLKEQEIANLLKLSKSTVHTQRMRAIRRLRMVVLPMHVFAPFFFFLTSYHIG